MRAHAEPTLTSADVPLVSLDIARAMNPRPPSPAAAAATQRKQRREKLNLKQLNTCGEVATEMQSMFPSHGQKDKTSGPSRAGSTSSGLMAEAVLPLSPSAESKAPVRPPRDARRKRPQLEVRGLVASFTEFLPTTVSFSVFLSLSCYANSTSSQNRASSSGRMAIFREPR